VEVRRISMAGGRKDWGMLSVTLATRSERSVVILGVKAVTAEVMLELSAVLKAEESEAVVVVLVIELATLPSAISSGRAWNIEPLKELTSAVRVSMSEEIVEMSERTVEVWRFLTGDEETRETPRMATR
jgi:hypothetical protein